MFSHIKLNLSSLVMTTVFVRLSLKARTGNVGMGRGLGNGERGTGNGESLKRGIFKSGNL